MHQADPCSAVALIAERLIHTALRLMLRCVIHVPLLLTHTRYDVVNSQQHCGRLDGCFKRLLLHGECVHDAEGLHVCDDPFVAIDTPIQAATSGGMPCTEVCQHAHDVGTAIVCEATRDHLEGLRHSPVCVLLRALLGFRLFLETGGELHLCGASAGQKPWLQHDVPCDAEGVLQIPLHLVQHILRGTPEDDRACFRIFALRHVGEILVTDLLDAKIAATSPDIRFRQLFRAIGDASATYPCDAVVVGLAHTPNHRDV
mmetsp:Transcript_60047/g.167561  ORF Transcript_60047/g.167561 Transcript_60047/m.167561 type:complete len:258 (+) Transcript_60047:134-907(+)